MSKKNEKDRRYRKNNREKLLKQHRELYREKQLRPPVTADRLRELLDYDQESGIFTYKTARGRFKSGDLCGHIAKTDGRVSIVVDGRMYRAHRLAWLYVTGEWPRFEIDHKDTNPSNNAWANLRDVTPTVNQQNRRAAPKGKKYSPLLGARWCAQIGRWKSAIKVNGKTKHLGVFDTDAEAAAAYLEAKRAMHEGCTL